MGAKPKPKSKRAKPAKSKRAKPAKRPATRPADLETFLRGYTAKLYPAKEIRFAKCNCGGDSFGVEVDDGGAARRTCQTCGTRHFLCDSEEYWDEAEPDECQCPCKGEVFNLAVGFAFYADGDDVKWMYIALRCIRCGLLGVYADWKIGYGPSIQLLEQV